MDATGPEHGISSIVIHGIIVIMVIYVQDEMVLIQSPNLQIIK